MRKILGKIDTFFDSNAGKIVYYVLIPILFGLTIGLYFLFEKHNINIIFAFIPLILFVLIWLLLIIFDKIMNK